MPRDVFISYAQRDKKYAVSVCDRFEKSGFTCWMAPRDIPGGADFAAEITKAITECRVVVLIFSSAANESRQIGREIKLADDFQKTVIPVRIEAVTATGSLAYFLGSAQWLEAVEAKEPPPEVLATVERHLGRNGEAPRDEPLVGPEYFVGSPPRRRDWRWLPATVSAILWAAIVATWLIGWRFGGQPPDGQPVPVPSAVTAPGAAPTVGKRPKGVFGVPDLARIYNFPSEYNGKGECIGLIELGGGYKDSDLETYFKEIGLSKPEIAGISVHSAADHPEDPDPSYEVTGDIEVASGAANGARIAIYFANGTDRGFWKR